MKLLILTLLLSLFSFSLVFAEITTGTVSVQVKTPATQSGSDHVMLRLRAPDLEKVLIGPVTIKKRTIKGKVLSLIKVKQTIYVEFQENSKSRKLWAAGPLTDISVGDKVIFSHSSVMKDFVAQGLNKEFDYIIFAGEINKFSANNGKNKTGEYMNDKNENKGMGIHGR